MKISAIVKVEVEVNVTGAWDNKCAIDQIYKQVADDAIGKIRHVIKNDKDIAICNSPKMSIMYTKDD